jgi:hypothetical protein
MNINKLFKFTSFIFTVLCIVSILVCMICNYAMNRSFTWSLIPVISIFFCWLLLISALLMGKNRVFFLILGMTYSILPFLYFLEQLVSEKDWFFRLGAPVTISSVVTIWTLYLIVKKFHPNIRLFLSCFFVLFGILYNTVLRYYICRFLAADFLELDYIISCLSSLIISICFFCIGLPQTILKPQSEQNKAN